MSRTAVELLQIVKRFGLYKEQGVRADSALNDLFEYISVREIQKIEAAREAFLTGHGRIGFDSICNELIQKYRHDPPTHKFTFL